ncbi:MAG: putative zinc-binding oxidoreductase [Frankiales bacterium]|nr:putative zinc-binding oxidoreductase [Frankiales bacterium]
MQPRRTGRAKMSTTCRELRTDPTQRDDVRTHSDVRVIGTTTFGGPDALEPFDLPDREAGPGQVRIRVRAAAVSPTDTFTRNGSRARGAATSPTPMVAGMDVAGLVDVIGAGVETDLRVGDEVVAALAPRGDHGGYSEQVVVPIESVARAPRGGTLVEAATLPMNGLTARLSLDLLGLEPGQTLAVTGAAGAYGGYVVQLAKADGLRVLADASEADEALVRSLGADEVVRRGDDVADRFLALAPGGVDAVADGALLHELVLPAIKDGGAIAVVRGWTAGPPPRGIVAHPTWVRDYLREGRKLARLVEQVEAGELTLRVAQALPAEQAPEAHRMLEAGGARGRFVLTF